MWVTEQQKRNLRKQIEGLYRRVAQLEARRDGLKARPVDELEALDFLWQEYVEADPATLTEDAKELAQRVRQKVRELAGVEVLEAERDALKARVAEATARAEADAGAIEWLLAECDALRARLAEVEARAAQMREVLEEALPAEGSGWWCPTCKCQVPDVEVTFEGYHDACGTYLETINSDAWRGRANTALSSDAGRETAERLRLLEELAEAATAFTERCRIVKCEARNVQEVCGDWDACPVERLEAAVKALKGGDDDAGTEA